MRSALGSRSVGGQVCALMLIIVTLLVLAAGATLSLQARGSGDSQARTSALTVARTVALAPGVQRALESRNPSTTLQPYVEKLRHRTDVDYIVVTSPRGVRWTHPNSKMLGKHIGHSLYPATAGRTFTDRLPGITRSAPSIRAAVPVTDARGRVIGIVNAGVSIPSVARTVGRQLPMIYGSTALALVLGGGGAALVARRLRRQTHRLGPAEITRMYEHHDAVLRSVKEGVLIVDDEGRLLLANDEALRLLGLTPDAHGRQITDVGLPPELAGLLASGRAATDAVYQVGDRLLAVNQRPAERGGAPWGSVATLRDATELRALTDKADRAYARLQLLYEAGVRVGSSLDMEGTAQELARVAVPRFADYATVDLHEAVLRGEEPGGRDSPLRRAAFSGIRQDPPLRHVGEHVSAFPLAQRAGGTGRARLFPVGELPSSPDWTPQAERLGWAVEYGIHSLLTVPLSARGVRLGQVAFWRSGDAPPFDEEDRSFAEELAGQAAVAIDNARRYAREHATTLALQESLLPRGRPEQQAVVAAQRYLPAPGGVRGDWFDVIPLSGARVALVVGDVVGHGLHAAATMGRLRTAVLNFSVVDLPPDELLARLDDVVDLVDREETAVNGGVGAAGATCLYAVYDPVSRHCTLARAGHPPPALVRPDGSVTFLDLPAGPPLGLGGRLYETTETQLPEGSRLVLYTDGLVRDRERDLVTGLDQLRDALTDVDPDPERACDAVMAALLSPRRTDDVCLLIARTTALDASRVASWELPSDPEVVGRMRAAVARTLADWNLEEAAFTTELVVSELLGNAIRHAVGPVRLRLMRNRALICEVADGSTTAPHLRRAATTDEGGRGLFLVAQMVQRWGTRYTSDGKIIWTEQDLPAAERAPR
ncbi:signal transduction histidine kinase regulating citrate/malate metabolism [Streptomyces violaceusniger Tu 4113]|uniref:protein-serine/threonine phosphatase n=1 Tax=Streptomyces violaceusniger (strain Tu 4113) TaxID=653045 RepID=G2P4J6_STRV4|nr:signal transduction histidine kinase regulating citrate/malate metabolism [Streptomyces violaceusniger Tu 4113]